MAIYRCRRQLFDSENNLHLMTGSFVITECQRWVQRFGLDLQQVDAVPTSGGYVVRTLTGLKEEALEVSVELSSTSSVEDPLVADSSPEVVADPAPDPVPVSRKVTRKA